MVAEYTYEEEAFSAFFIHRTSKFITKYYRLHRVCIFLSVSSVFFFQHLILFNSHQLVHPPSILVGRKFSVSFLHHNSFLFYDFFFFFGRMKLCETCLNEWHYTIQCQFDWITNWTGTRKRNKNKKLTKF